MHFTDDLAGPNPCSYAIGWTLPTIIFNTWPPIKECVNKDQIDQISPQHWLLVSKVAGAPSDNRVPGRGFHSSAPYVPH